MRASTIEATGTMASRNRPRTGPRRTTCALAWLQILASLALAGWLAAPASAADEQAPPRKQLLTGRHSRDDVAGALLPRDEWKPFPPAADRGAWEALRAAPLNVERQQYVVERAEAILREPWPALPASLYMEFARNGNRSHYERPYFLRRQRLAVLVLAECFEHSGRFLDAIADGVWAICEESTWCIPAHATRYRGDVLHRPDVQSLDLFACETGMTLAQTLYLLEPELAKLSRAVVERIRSEVRRRIIDPYEAGDDFGRSGWIRGFNNWAPWCASNVLGAAFYLEDDRDRLADMTFRLMQVADRFIDRYGEDGGCDEGPGYWNEAGGALLVFLELLRSRTAGAVDIWGDPKIAAMGEYIARAHIAGPWFANFADADAKSSPHPGKVYRYGERIGSAAMENLALLSMRRWRRDGPVDPPLRISGVGQALLGPLMEIFWVPPAAVPGALQQESQVWLPDLQVAFARESTDTDRGLALAAKGGNNGESHNHNDVGQFIIFLDGAPGIVDVGRETYTRKTFSSERYDLWFTRGLAHNAPVVDGVEQHAGGRYAARNVVCEESGGGLTLSMDLEGAYPASAHLAALRRQILFRREPEALVEVRDHFEFTGDAGSVLVRLYAASEPRAVTPGRIAIACRPRTLILEHDPGALAAAIEPVPLEDENLRDVWGERLYRIDLTTPAAAKSGGYSLKFHAGDR